MKPMDEIQQNLGIKMLSSLLNKKGDAVTMTKIIVNEAKIIFAIAIIPFTMSDLRRINNRLVYITGVFPS